MSSAPPSRIDFQPKRSVFNLGDCSGVRGIDVLWRVDVKASMKVLRDARRMSKVGTETVALFNRKHSAILKRLMS